MAYLLKKQEIERKDLAAGVYKEWQPVKEKEDKLLATYGGKYENAPLRIQEEINKGRNDYFQRWGSDGKLTVLMSARHIKEQEDLVQRQALVKQLREKQQRNKERDRGR